MPKQAKPLPSQDIFIPEGKGIGADSEVSKITIFRGHTKVSKVECIAVMMEQRNGGGTQSFMVTLSGAAKMADMIKTLLARKYYSEI